MTALIQSHGLRKEFPTGSETIVALRDIDIAIARGEFTGLIGPSGSGKTTLLNLMGALDKPSAGSIEVLGHDIQSLDSIQAAALRSHSIGFIFQSYHLLGVYTVYENVEFPLLLEKVPESERKKRVMESLDWVGLADRAHHRPTQLSGGQCQRVSIARAMVKRPEILLADEPTANLDSRNSFVILDTMKKINAQMQTTFVFSTHDEKVIGYLHRQIHLADGAVVKDIQIPTEKRVEAEQWRAKVEE